jgi:hypothetical protein
MLLQVGEALFQLQPLLLMEHTITLHKRFRGVRVPQDLM